MTFWIVAALLAVGVGAMVARPLMRPAPEADHDVTDVDIYRDQLAEIERDIERGVLSGDEAERTRTEVARRLLAADAAQESSLSDAPLRGTRSLSILMGLLVALGGLWLYGQLGAVSRDGPYPDLPLAVRHQAAEEAYAARPSQEEMEQAALGAFVEFRAGLDPAILEALAVAEAALAETPDDPEALRRAALANADALQFSEAATLGRALISRLAENVTIAELVFYLDMLVFAADGQVSREAEELAHLLTEIDPGNAAAGYTLGLMYDQLGRPDIAFRLYRRVVEDSDPASRHATLARRFIADAATQAGIDYLLPPAPGLSGPTADQMAAAADMDPEARAEMIRGMVEGLSARLATEGGTAADWARLIVALSVLGEDDRAQQILGEARSVFTRSPNDAATIEAAAAEAGFE